MDPVALICWTALFVLLHCSSERLCHTWKLKQNMWLVRTTPAPSPTPSFSLSLPPSCRLYFFCFVLFFSCFPCVVNRVEVVEGYRAECLYFERTQETNKQSVLVLVGPLLMFSHWGRLRGGGGQRGTPTNKAALYTSKRGNKVLLQITGQILDTQEIQEYRPKLDPLFLCLYGLTCL